jgi:hypothetical protein
MKKILDTINNFIIEEFNLIIQCDKNTLILPIINGSIKANLLNELKEKIGLNEININDQIIIYYKEIENQKEKNYIKPIKIIKLLNYEFNNDTSDSDIM